MPDSPKPIIGYLLATHGVRKLTKDHPAIRQQFANLRAWESAQGGRVKLVFKSDYARKIDGLDALPALHELLGAGVGVVMDDLSRLFRPCRDVESARALLKSLNDYRDQIFGLRQRSFMGKLSTQVVKSLVLGQIDPRFDIEGVMRSKRPRSSDPGQTQAANVASAKARGKAADEAAISLEKVRKALQSEGKTGSLAQIVERANAEGLRTTRGNFWRADTVSRTLRRIRPDAG